MNPNKIEILWREILKEIGDNPDRKGLKDTPKRISTMYQEIYRGYDKLKKPKITTFENNEDGIKYGGMVCDKGHFFSYCEHHGIPFFGEYFFGYVPDKKLIGLSKVARIVDYYSSKLQIQERLTKQIADELESTLTPRGMVLIIKARHLCKEMRGVRKIGGEMVTSEVRGCFRENKNGIREEFFSIMKLI